MVLIGGWGENQGLLNLRRHFHHHEQANKNGPLVERLRKSHLAPPSKMLKMTTYSSSAHHTVNHSWTVQSPLAFGNSFIFVERTEVGTGLRQKYL